MQIAFSKFQGTGNDFIIIDQRFNHRMNPNDQQLIERMCDRRFGIGADGLILLVPSETRDFKMLYFNSDGRQSSMCGNGGRCIVMYAWLNEIIKEECSFEAVDGIHQARITDKKHKIVSLQMQDVLTNTRIEKDIFILNTGSPHYVKIGFKLPDNIFESGKKIRYSEPFKDEGININFVALDKENLHVATYERGVEDETFSCGTGVTAAALAYSLYDESALSPINIVTKGGSLSVDFKYFDGRFTDVWLTGPATHVFDGIYVCEE